MHSTRLLPAALVALALVLPACGSDSDSSSDAPTTTRAAGTGETVATAAKSGDTDSKNSATGKLDCAAVSASMGKLIVNWQLVAQLPRETDVANWSQVATTIGSIDTFGAQLSDLADEFQGNADAEGAITFMQGANEIVQRGLAGDTVAPAQLAAYLGDDTATILGKKTPIVLAAADAGC